ncbi:MAG: iron-containing alcohol dehydrogenase [Acidobacteriota bacterium]|nr:iron-containing alcohol dehydrogenase [Acidobacteriota bacterium]
MTRALEDTATTLAETRHSSGFGVPFEFYPRTRLVFGGGTFDRLSELATDLGMTRPLLVADQGLVDAGHVTRARNALTSAGTHPTCFHDFDVNPDTAMIEKGCVMARPHKINGIIGLGGGSSLDCAKGINLLLTNGGRLQDYQGYGKALQPMLPMIGVPTTAGTGSEAQSYAVIADAATHMKMACGDPKVAFRVSLLDPELTLSQPKSVTATSGFDAIAHAVETAVTTRRTPLSTSLSGEAWRLLSDAYPVVLRHADDQQARAAMQLGAYYAGWAIEQSMLGAAHACANPLTARYGVTHGVALSILLPHVVRWNGTVADPLYARLLEDQHSATGAAEHLATRLRELADQGELPSRLRAEGVNADTLPELATAAASQWTARFNPRPLTPDDALEIYRCAF